MRGGLTNKTLFDLSQRISLGIKKDRNGEKINPVVPPKNITYEMLYNECLGDEQVPRITKVEKKTLKATFKKNTKYPDYRGSIGVQILLNDELYELERVKWWCDWYKIMKGNRATSTRPRGLTTNSSLRKAKTFGGSRKEQKIQELYSILIPIRNGLLYLMRKKTYTAEDVLHLTARLMGNDIDKINAANEETRELFIRKAQTGGAGDDSVFVQAKDKLIKKIMKIEKKNTIEGIIQRDYILKLAEECLNMRNVKSVSIVNKKSRKKMPSMAYDVKLEYINTLLNDIEVIQALYGKQQQLAALSRPTQLDVPTIKALYGKQQQLEGLSRKAQLDALRLQAKINADPRRNKQLKEVQAQQGTYRQHTQLQSRILHAEQEAQIRQAQAEASRQQAEQAEQEEITMERLFKDMERQRYERERRSKIPQGQRFPNTQGQSRFYEELEDVWSRAEIAQAERATPVATRATPAPQPTLTTQDDSNLGSLETWDAISSNKGLRWDDISGIQGIVGSNNNTVASVMLFLYLRDNYTAQATIAKLKKKHFGYSDTNFDQLVSGFKKEVFKTTATQSIGEEFFKLKDKGAMVYSISRATLLRQRLNRVFFFLARNIECNSYFYYKRSRGEGYDFANLIGMTDEDFLNGLDGETTNYQGGEIPKQMKVKIFKWLLLNSPDKVQQRDVKAGVDPEANKYTATYITKRMYSMLENNFFKWFQDYKTNKKLNTDEDPFCPVEQFGDMDWDRYNNGGYDDKILKLWFD